MLNTLVSSSYPKPQIRMKLKFILFIVLTSLSSVEVSTEPVLPNFLVPETLNPAFAGTLITEYTGLIHRLNGHEQTNRYRICH
jgi:hypothetical protein